MASSEEEYPASIDGNLRKGGAAEVEEAEASGSGLCAPAAFPFAQPGALPFTLLLVGPNFPAPSRDARGRGGGGGGGGGGDERGRGGGAGGGIGSATSSTSAD